MIINESTAASRWFIPLKSLSLQALQGQRKKEEHHLIYEQYNQLIFDLGEGQRTFDVSVVKVKNGVKNFTRVLCG